MTFYPRFPLEVEVLFPSNTYNPRACVLSTKTKMRNETQGNVILCFQNRRTVQRFKSGKL